MSPQPRTWAVSVFVVAGSPEEAEGIVQRKLGPIVRPLKGLGTARRVEGE
jgi:hypothetical protein